MEREDQLFLLGLVSLVFSLFLFPFVVYLFPAVWLGWEYRIPSFVVDVSLWIQIAFDTSYAKAFLWFFRLTFFAAIIFGVIAYLSSHHITKLQAEENEVDEMAEVNAVHETNETNEINEENGVIEAAEAAEKEALVKAVSKYSKIKGSSKESVIFFLKMVVIIGLVFIAADMVQWAISFSPAPQ